jgi:glucose-6-phosphate isomerase
MLEAERVFARRGLDFPRHAVAVTMLSGSSLHEYATARGWLHIFEIKDWVGGRTSVLSAVGLLPARLIGADISGLLGGASAMDALTRVEDGRNNPAMLLALMWYHAGGGSGRKDMVILPYCDRLALLGRYLQQLVMESLGKEYDRQGRRVNQGIAVYGNKGSTDQHAYIQQLREGLNNFFATFVEIRGDRERDSPVVDDKTGATSGDFLQGFLRGTRDALRGNGRESITVTFDRLDACALGAMIALFERAVSFYASLVDINAYHQPGVQAGKEAAGRFLDAVAAAGAVLSRHAGRPLDAAAIHDEVVRSLPGIDLETVYHAANHLAASRPGIEAKRGSSPAEDRFTQTPAA